MKKDLIISAVVGAVIVLVIGGFAAYSGVVPHLSGDFAGGIQPSQLLTANVTTNSESPALSNFYVPGAISIGGTAANNQTVLQYTATAAFPAAAITLGTFSATTSTTSTQITIPVAGFSTGDPCSEVFYNGDASTSPTVSYDANISTTSASSATATVLFMNVGNTTQTFTVTSTATGASSTVKLTCRHAGV